MAEINSFLELIPESKKNFCGQQNTMEEIKDRVIRGKFFKSTNEPGVYECIFCTEKAKRIKSERGATNLGRHVRKLHKGKICELKESTKFFKIFALSPPIRA